MRNKKKPLKPNSRRCEVILPNVFLIIIGSLPALRAMRAGRPSRAAYLGRRCQGMAFPRSRLPRDAGRRAHPPESRERASLSSPPHLRSLSLAAAVTGTAGGSRAKPRPARRCAWRERGGAEQCAERRGQPERRSPRRQSAVFDAGGS